MAEGQGASSEGTEGQFEQLARPSVAAILESQPVPAFWISDSGRLILPNSRARRFVTETAEGRGIRAQDGTDLWTVLLARADEASPFFDVRMRVREQSAEVIEVFMTVVPVRGAGGVLAGAVVFVLSVPAERVHPVEQAPADGDRLQAVVRMLAALTGADGTYVVEFDSENFSEAKARAYWSRDGSTPSASFGMKGSPSSSFAGRKMLVIPSGLARAYPDLPMLQSYQAYVGAALLGDSGEQIGSLAAVWHEPLEDVAGMSAVLSIVSMEASHALRHEMARRELAESEQRYSAVFEGSATPMLLIEPLTTQVVDANPAACEFYGYPHEEFLSMSILQLDALSAEALHGEIERAADGARSRFASQHILSGGRLRDVELSLGMIMVTGRRLLYCMVTDITDRKRIEAELDRSRRSLERMVGQRTQDLLRANAELQQASMSRDLVIGSLAQEVRTAVQTITGFSGLLLDDASGLSAEQRRQLETVHREGERLETFILGLEARRQDPTAPNEEEFDLVSLVESMSFGLASFAEDKGLSLRLVAQERPLAVTSDRYKIQQILLNLLSNAIRYTDQGGVTITVERLGDGSPSVRVADTGAGIDRATLESIFEGPEVNEEKVGIGLPASRRIAGVIGGSIEADSTPAKGSTFTLRLPAPLESAE